MRKTIFVLILYCCGLSTAFSESGDWVLFSEDTNARWYTLKGEGDLNNDFAMVWFLADLKRPMTLTNGVRYQSFKTLEGFNCGAYTSHRVKFIAFAGPFGGGGQVPSSEESSRTQSEEFAPDDWKARGYENFCKKRWQFWK